MGARESCQPRVDAATRLSAEGHMLGSGQACLLSCGEGQDLV